jgi:1-acyl-sn-glycerol-3-phosphate acyltransferase
MTMGFWYISIKGNKRNRDECPIAVANHSSAFDGFILAYLQSSSPIMKAEAASNPRLFIFVYF